ncbi:MAG: CarD family transcriptional regulator [Gemmatimonadota bacterium]
MTRMAVNFTKNQKVVHPLFGGGYISGEETIVISGEQVRCLTIRCVSRDRKVYVPKSSLPFSKIRRPHADMKRIVEVLLAAPVTLATNFNRRMKDLKEKLDTGETLMIAEIVRYMYRGYHANELSNSDQKLFEKTQDLLVSELALIKDLNYDEAQGLLDETMTKQRKARKSRAKSNGDARPKPAVPVIRNGKAVRV